MESTAKPKVLFVYYTFTNQALRVTEDMESVFHDRGWDTERAEIELTDHRYVKNFARFPMKHRYFDVVRMLPAQLRRATGEVGIPAAAKGGSYDLVVIGSPTWWLTTCLPIRSYLKSDEAGGLLAGKSVAGFVVCRRYWKNNLKTVKKLAEAHGATSVGETHFAYLGGQVRSLLSLISYLGTGEYRERYLGIKIPPTNIQPDDDDAARVFAGELIDRVGAAGSSGGERMRKSALVVAILTGLTALAVSAAPWASAAKSVPKRGVVTIQTATVGDPGNPSVGVWQVFKTLGNPGAGVTLPEGTGIYPTCADAPADAPSCLTVGGVKNTFGIGEFEITVAQYVTFLNTVDPAGKNLRQLYEDNMNTEVWPQYGPIRYTSGSGATGKHYAVAYPEWAQKPFNFGDFRRGAQFVNSLFNGKVLSKTSSTKDGFKYVTYKVRLSPKIERGMYDMTKKTPKRTASTGFVLPSNNEWVKAAYYDPNHGGTDSYWLYPTGPFDQPNVSVLDPATGDVTNAETQPLATYNPNDPNSSVDTPGAPAGTAPTWCPSQAGPSCADTFPADFPPGLDLPPLFMGNVSTIGQAKTPSPWGAYDMGGNVVEHTDSVAPQPPGYDFIRDWRYYHGGVANAPAYQVAIYAFGYFPGDPQVGRIYPWMGFRVGVVGNVK